MAFQSYLQKSSPIITTVTTSSKMRNYRSMPTWSLSDYLRILCLLLATISAMLSAAIVGTAIHVFHTFKVQTAANNPWWLPLWPKHFDTMGTKVSIGAGVGVLLLELGYIVVAVVPKWNQPGRTFLTSLAGIVMATASALVALFSVILIFVLNRRSPRSDTIQTWTCKFSSSIPGATSMAGVNANLSNDMFSTLCKESKFAFYGMISVACLQGILFLAAIARWFTGRSATRNDSYFGRSDKAQDDGFSF